jgi:hypothetical protein
MMERPQLYWFGKPADAKEIELVEQHGFKLVVHRKGDTPDFWHARAAIFWGMDAHFAAATVCLRDFAKAALDDGVHVVAVVSGAKDGELLLDANKQLSDVDRYGARKSHYRVLSAPVELHEVLHLLLVHNPGVPRNTNLQICGEVEIDEESRFLLQRAFHDCGAVLLEPISPGFSGADTFIVKATLTNSNAGPEPRPFFAKLGRSDELQKEWSAFREYAEHHVPWYLRPNFVPERTTFGVTNGILVGTFVQNSFSLAQAVREPNGARHIESLFHETLAGMRRQRRTTTSAEAKSAVGVLRDFCKREKVPTERWQAAAAMFGGEEVDPDTLWWGLLGLPAREWVRSAIHGDLHGENVRVRKEDAIVIDFAHAGTGPACADLAHLEIALVFDLGEQDLMGEAWRRVIAELYSPKAVAASVDDPRSEIGTTWIHAAVAQVRSLVLGSVQDAEEYMRVLAVYLLRQASYPANKKDAENDEYRRTFAYWLACRLTETLQQQASSTVAVQ